MFQHVPVFFFTTYVNQINYQQHNIIIRKKRGKLQLWGRIRYPKNHKNIDATRTIKNVKNASKNLHTRN
jgi:hypothetical protein